MTILLSTSPRSDAAPTAGTVHDTSGNGHPAPGTSIIGDSLAVMRTLPSNSVDLVVTSPPYDGQPKYGDGESYETELGEPEPDIGTGAVAGSR